MWTEIINALKKGAKNNVTQLLAAAQDHQLKETLAKKWEQIKAIYDGFGDEELRESWRSFPDVIKELFWNRMTDDEIDTYMKKLIPTGPFSELLDLKEDEEADPKAEEKGDSSITLARIDLFPELLYVRVMLKPGYMFSAFARGSADNLKALWNAKEGESSLKLRAGIRGALSLKAIAELDIGPELILQGYGNLYAGAELKGGIPDDAGTSVTADGSTGVAFQTDVEVPFKRGQDGSIEQSGDLRANLQAGLKLDGMVGTEIGLRSRILMWEKKLYEKEFARWNLLAVHAVLGVKKAPGGGIFKGWELETASVSVAGNFKDAFLKENTEEKKYGLYTPGEAESQKYQDISDNFDTALKLLEDFADAAQKNGPALLFPSKGGDDEGVRGMAVKMGEHLNRIITVWADAQNELEHLEQVLQERTNSKSVKKKYEDAAAARLRHENRMDYLERWDEAKDGNLLEYYKKEESSPGSGFVDFMYQEFLDTNRSYESIVAYERARYQEKTEKHFKRLADLDEMKAKGKTEAQIQAAYFDDMDGGRVKEEKARLKTTRELLAYEYGRMMEATKDARKSRTEVMELAAKTDRKRFFETYAKTYADAGVIHPRFANEELFSFGDAEILLTYEKEKYLKEAGAQEKDIAMLGAADAGLELLRQDPRADSQRLITQFRSALKGDSQKAPSLAEAFAQELYRTATADDLLEIELQSSQGEAGQRLMAYLEKTTEAVSGEKEKGRFTAIFGGKMKRNEAMRRFGAYLEKSGTSELISCLTLDILMDYAIMRQRASKKKEAVAREIQYLARGQAKMAAAPKGEARKVEEEYIAGYFKQFSGVEQQYRKALTDRKVMNLPLMLQGLSDTSENPVFAKLMEMKEAKEPDYKILLTYLEMKGDEKKVKALINEHQKKKAEETDLDIGDAHRFYESRIAETSGHYERYQKLRDMHSAGQPYEALLDTYQKLGAGNGYREYLIKELGTGVIGGREIPIADVLRAEDKRIDRLGEKHMARLSVIHRMEDEGSSYAQILDAYKAQADEQNPAVLRLVKSKTGFEKTMKKQEINSDDLIAYERLRAEEAGKKHAMRLRALLGLPETSDAFMSAELIADSDEREAKREDYLRKTKRFRKSELESDMKKADFEKELSLRPAQELKQSLQSYEASRKHAYEDKAGEILDAQKEIQRMRDDLEQKTALCRAMSNTVINIRENPAMVFEELKHFRETVAFLKQNGNFDAAAKEQSQRAHACADAAIHRISELEEG